MVERILVAKLRLGLFERPFTSPDEFPLAANAEHLAAARESATESIVLLTNDRHDDRPTLPLDANALRRVAVIGPLADDPHEQLGTWVFDGDARFARTPLQAMRELLGDTVEIVHERALVTTRSYDRSAFEAAVSAAVRSDVAVLFVGEEAILSGEAHCRADITLPGAQQALIEAISATGTPTIAVVMSGRPLALEAVVPHVRALVCAWHGGTMAGPAIVDVLFGVASPSGKLPITLPRVTGQIPIYYAHKHTGKPPTPETFVHIDDIEPRAPQLSVGNTSFHLDAGYTPLFSFGHGLSYATFDYSDLRLSSEHMTIDGTIEVAVTVTNSSHVSAHEVVQLYVRDLVGSVTRPVKELKAFAKIHLEAGERRDVSFSLSSDDLAFYGRTFRRSAEPGRFHLWVGGSSDACLRTEFLLTES